MNFADNLRRLARDNVLRASINTGNRALVQQAGDTLSGISPALAARLAEEIGARLEPVVYNGAGKVFADAGADVWDVGFLAIDAMRAEKISYTVPYISIEATFAVRASSDITRIEQVDVAGRTVLTASGSAYDMYLKETLMNATLERFGTPPESFAEFQRGRCDAVAGVRQSLEGVFANDPDVRILSGVLTAVHQAMVLPRKDDPRIAALNDFVERAIADGFVASHS